MSSASRRSFFCRQRARRRISVASPSQTSLTEFFEQLFEPGTVTTGFQPDDHAPLELLVESAHFVFVLVL